MNDSSVMVNYVLEYRTLPGGLEDVESFKSLKMIWLKNSVPIKIALSGLKLFRQFR